MITKESFERSISLLLPELQKEESSSLSSLFFGIADSIPLTALLDGEEEEEATPFENADLRPKPW